MAIATATDSAGRHWRIHDPVHQVREWGTATVHALPTRLTRSAKLTIGSTETSWLRLQDPELLVSRQHAQLTYDPPDWILTDLQSKNGVLVDGVPRSSVPLTPGMEILIGGVTLTAESPRFCALRDALSRLIGWSPDRMADVDVALRAVRTSVTLHEPLTLFAEAGHKSIARLIHRHVIGAERPLVVCERRKSGSKRRARHLPTFERGADAFAAAAGGTLIVQKNRLPDDFDQVLMSLRAPTARVLLIVCSQDPPLGISTQIIVPPLSGRVAELDRVIDAYAADAMDALGIKGTLPADDRRWVSQQQLTFAEIEAATLKLVVLRAEGNIKPAARRLGMTHSSLSDWLARRDIPALQGAQVDRTDASTETPDDDDE